MSEIVEFCSNGPQLLIDSFKGYLSVHWFFHKNSEVSENTNTDVNRNNQTHLETENGYIKIYLKQTRTHR